MAEHIPTTPYLSVAGVELTAWLRSAVSIERTADEIDTSSASSRTRTFNAGLFGGRVRFTLKQSYEANGPDVTLRGRLGETVEIITRPEGGSASVTNPTSTFNAVITSVPTATGRLGELSEFSAEWPISGTVAVTT